MPRKNKQVASEESVAAEENSAEVTDLGATDDKAVAATKTSKKTRKATKDDKEITTAPELDTEATKSEAEPVAEETAVPDADEPEADVAEPAVVEPKNAEAKAEEPAEETSDAKTKAPNPHRHKKFALIFSIVLFGLLLIWSGLALAFGNYRLGNQKISLLSSRSAISNDITQQAQNYKITVAYPNNQQKSFALSDVGFQLNLPASVSSLQKGKLHNYLTWWKASTGQLVYGVDQTKFNNFITKSLTVTVQPATDAKLKINNGNISIVDAVTGKRYGLTYPFDIIKAAASNLQNQPIKLSLLADNPNVTSSQLQSYKAKLSQVLNQQIVFTIASQTVSAKASDIGNWLELTPDKKQNTVDISVNSGKVVNYINNLASNYIHPPRAKVEVKQSDGTLKTLVNGVNGVDITDKSNIATQIANNLLLAKGMQFNLTITNAPYETILAGDYNKWIEVDITNKRMYAYEKSTLIRTFLITAGAPATPTVTGEYSIYAKYVQQNMSGLNVDGSSYFQPNVPWVNYFYKDFAIHGNYWRPLSYFGNVNSSHGCVGVTPPDGEWIYNWAPIGTKVIIHT